MTSMKLQMVVRGLVLAGITLLLNACALNGYISAPEGAERVVQNGGYVPEALAQVAIFQNPDFNKGKITPKAFRKIQEYGISCQRQADAQVAGQGQAAATGIINQGPISAVSEAASADAANFARTSEQIQNYGMFGLGLGVGFGALNGMTSGSYDLASLKGECTRGFWGDVRNTDPAYRGTHVGVVRFGKKWGGSLPPALDRSAVAQPPR